MRACAVGFGQSGGKTKKRRGKNKPVVILEDGLELPPSSMEVSCSTPDNQPLRGSTRGCIAVAEFR